MSTENAMNKQAMMGLLLGGCSVESWEGPAADAVVLRCADYEAPEVEISGLTYYVDGGSDVASDDSDGLSPQTPWRRARAR
ncbi:MAG: hypothetical protein ACI8S6_005303 [Myxococcota bacterium]|jgi:hypothetical protein